MKKVIILLLFTWSSFLIVAQPPFPTSVEINNFISSKTCVVLEDDSFSPFNAYIKQAMKEYWTITPYEFISTVLFKERRYDPAFSFIVLTVTNFERDKSGSAFNFLNLLQGKNVMAVGEMPEICAIPLSFAGEEDMEYGYKLGAILSFIQQHAKMISGDPSLISRRYLKYYNKNIPSVIGKTILVKQEDLAPSINTIEKVRAIYKFKIEIVPEESIVKAIQEKVPNTLILHKVGPGSGMKAGYCFKMLIGTDDADMYYYNHHLINKDAPDGLLPADLKRLMKY